MTAGNVVPTSTNAIIEDLNALRLPPTYGESYGVKKVLTVVPVGKPSKPQFFRVHPDPEMTFRALLLEQKDTGEKYLVHPEAAQTFSELVRPVMLYTAVDRQGNVFFIPVPLPGESGNRNPWHDSLAQAAERAKTVWLRISANMSLGAYDVYEAEGALPDPVWPDATMLKLLEVAFRDRVISGSDHPIVQSLLGRV